MKKNAELPVAESVKLCIELDKETLEKWNWTKKDFEGTLEYVHGTPLISTDEIVFKCLLFCYEEGDIDALPISFAANLSKEETESIKSRIVRIQEHSRDV